MTEQEIFEKLKEALDHNYMYDSWDWNDERKEVDNLEDYLKIIKQERALEKDLDDAEMNRLNTYQEFFEKNGFVLLESVDYLDNYFTSEDMRIDVYEASNGWVVHIDNIAFSTAFCNCLKYVHELQNAYYISTGEELEIKL